MPSKTDPLAQDVPTARQVQLYRALEAILLSPQTGAAVARTLGDQSSEREGRMLVADLRARRVQHLYDHDADRLEADRLASPWARPA